MSKFGLPLITIRWIPANYYAEMFPQEAKGDLFIFISKDLARLRDWLTGDLAAQMVYKIMPPQPDPNNIKETMRLIFEHSNLNLSINDKVNRDIKDLKLAWQNSPDTEWRKFGSEH